MHVWFVCVAPCGCTALYANCSPNVCGICVIVGVLLIVVMLGVVSDVVYCGLCAGVWVRNMRVVYSFCMLGFSVVVCILVLCVLL